VKASHPLEGENYNTRVLGLHLSVGHYRGVLFGPVR